MGLLSKRVREGGCLMIIQIAYPAYTTNISIVFAQDYNKPVLNIKVVIIIVN